MVLTEHVLVVAVLDQEIHPSVSAAVISVAVAAAAAVVVAAAAAAVAAVESFVCTCYCLECNSFDVI